MILECGSFCQDSINERLKIVANALRDLLTGLLGHSSDTRLRCVVQVLKVGTGVSYRCLRWVHVCRTGAEGG